MPSERFVRTRTPGWCDSEFAHPGQIHSGDIVCVTTYFPRGELFPALSVRPWARSRACQWCVLTQEAQNARRGMDTLRLRDKHGDVWRVGEDGLMHTRETMPFPFEHVQKKWGPLKVVPRTRPSDPSTGDVS